MDVAIVTVGDELLSGDVADTNGAWLAKQITNCGCTVREIVSLPDRVDAIESRLARLSQSGPVLVTGGVGGTPDDVTMDAVAACFDTTLTVYDDVRESVRETIESRDREYADFDLNAWAALPTGSRPISNPTGLSPGCVISGVYVFPGIPSEMKPMFELVAEEFAGDIQTETTWSDRSETDLVSYLEAVPRRFQATVGCYPDRETGWKRIVFRASDPAEAREARDWFAERVDADSDPSQ